MHRYRDILITNDDITLDVGGQPLMVTGRASIAQDIVHMIRESGLLVQLIGNRDVVTRQTSIVKISLLVDTDYRIVPGTTVIEESKLGEYWLTAETVAYGPLNIRLNAGVEK